MLPLITYSMMMEEKSKEGKFRIRLELIRYALSNGIRETKRAFRCSRNTVRLWVRRYKEDNIAGIRERSKAPKNIPHKTASEIEEEIVSCRLKVPCYGPRRLKMMFSLKPSEGAIARVLKARGLVMKDKKEISEKKGFKGYKS